MAGENECERKTKAKWDTVKNMGELLRIDKC